MKFIDKYSVSPEGVVINTKTGRVLYQELLRTGYKRVTLCISGKVIRYGVHRLMAMLYLGNKEGMDVNHKDGIKTNNRVDNLEWVSRKDNIQHSIENGLRKLGGRAYNATMTDEFAHLICKLIEQGFSREHILSNYPISKHVFDDLRKRKTWKHISKEYKWQNVQRLSKA